MTNYDDVALRWADRALGLTTKGPLSAREGRMYCTSDHQIYSYGSHFEMGRFLLRKGKPVAILLNGERWGPTTSRHQGCVRAAAQRTGLPTVILPYTALTNAGVMLDSIEIIDVTPDRNIETVHRFSDVQPNWRWRDDPVTATIPYTQDEVDVESARAYGRLYRDWACSRERAAEVLADPDAPQWRRDLYTGQLAAVKPTWADARAKVLTRYGYEHWPQHYNVVDHERNLYVSGRCGATQVTINRDDDGTTRYSYVTSRHLLGGSLIRATYTESRRVKCKTCAGQGVTEEKQSDWYDVAADYPHLSDAERHRLAHRCPTCYGIGRHTVARDRKAYFISDFDHNEPRELYFFCELPRGVRPTTLAEAIEMLKPETVRMAEQMGRQVARQGDIFAIQIKHLEKRGLRKAGARLEKAGRLLGTNHIATEVAYMPNGQTLARGVLRHAPEFRQPDHVRVKLDDGWHVILKNTVPIA